MKKIIMVVIVVSLFVSCDLIFNTVFDEIQKSAVCGQELYDGDFPEMTTFREVANYVCSNLSYIQDGILAPLVGPKESLTRGYGDCDEYALVFMNVAYFTLGVKFDFVSLYVDKDYTGNRSIGIGGRINHSLVKLDGVIYSVYNGKPCPELEDAYSYKFYEVFCK